MPFTMDSPGSIPVLLLAVFLVFAVTSRLLTATQKDTLLSYLPLAGRGRRDSASKTPPRSLSPSKKAYVATTPSSPADYKNIFPPSTRECLPIAAQTLSLNCRQSLKGESIDEIHFRKNVIPFEADFRQCGPSTFTPMAISIEEVNALGDFPNYAALSNVPLPEAYKEFKIETALPRPYRPFRWAYHQTMSLNKMETNWWLELEKSYVEMIRLRKELYEKHGGSVLEFLPGSELACKELMEMVLQFYCARYPQFFRLTEYEDDGRGYVFDNALLNKSFVIKDHHPLHILLDNVPEDFAIMLRNPDDGYYYFRAGMICSSLGWNLGTKIGMQLREIHEPIPDYKEKMEFSMDRYFSKMPPSKPIQRGSWGLEVDTPLFMPPGDPHEDYRLTQDPEMHLDRLNLRVDWQTLRRLPLSGAIVFNFKGLFTPLREFRDEPYVPALVRKVLTSGKKNMMEYKNTWHTEHVVLPALEAWDQEQKEKGLIEKDWEVKTLEESPWFPGWKEKWHRQQGF